MKRPDRVALPGSDAVAPTYHVTEPFCHAGMWTRTNDLCRVGKLVRRSRMGS